MTIEELNVKLMEADLEVKRQHAELLKAQTRAEIARAVSLEKKGE